jgi:hydroxymethylpyrimidine pyrophosphatase-like HAD family hydrolase
VDFDGTIAEDDVLDRDAADAIQRARAAGILAILATGRILEDLDRLLPSQPLFDAVVAENGAVLRLASQASPTVLARSPHPAFLESLERSGVRHRSGLCVVEAAADSAPRVLDSIRHLGAPLALSFNRDRLMVLPEGVTKGSGLQEALWRLRASGHNAVGIGNAENDHSLLEACELGAAVSWGSASLQEVAELVIHGEGPSAVARFVGELVPARMIPPDQSRRRWIRLGALGSGEPFELALRGRNMLIGGDPRSGKSWITGLICEQLILQRYSVCVLDPEGDYACLDALPGVIVHAIESEDASLSGVERILRRPDLSLVVDMSGATTADKPGVVRRVLGLANRLRRQNGVPHRIVIDEAHYFLGRLDDPELFEPELGGHLLVTYRIADLSAEVLRAADAVIVTKVADERQALALRSLAQPTGTTSEWRTSLAGLAIDEAMLLPGAQESGDRLTRFRIAARMTEHVRHRKKYRDVSVPPGREFVFTRNGQETGQRAKRLADLVELLPGLPNDVFEGHLRRGDFHRWAERVLGDAELGDALRGAEGLEGARAREAIAKVISDRYGTSM